MLNKLANKSLVIWDAWFAVNQNGLYLDDLMKRNDLEAVKAFDGPDPKDDIKYVIFKVTNGS